MLNYKKIKFIIIISIVLFLFTACSKEASPTPELAIKEYFSRINQNSELQIIHTNAFGGKIMVFYKHSGQYCFQWVKPCRKGFLVAGNPYLFAIKEKNFIDVSTIHGQDLGNEFSAVGLYINDSRISHIKAQLSNGDSMAAVISKGYGRVEIFEGHVIVKSIIAYDKNDEVVNANYFN